MSAEENKKLILESLKSLSDNGREFFDQDEKNNLCQILYSMLNFDKIHKQLKSINKYLIEYGYQICSAKGTKGEERDKTYWTIQKAEKGDQKKHAKSSGKSNKE